MVAGQAIGATCPSTEPTWVAQDAGRIVGCSLLPEAMTMVRPDGLVLPSQAGTPLRVQDSRRSHLDRAAGPEGLVPRDASRAASLAIASGAAIEGVQSMVGHASPP